MISCGKCGQSFPDTRALVGHPCDSKPITVGQFKQFTDALEELITTQMQALEQRIAELEKRLP